MRHFNVCSRSDYIDPRDGKRKFKWLLVGHMRVTEVGAYYLILNQQPNVQFELFEQRVESKQTEQPLDTISNNEGEDPDLH